MTLPAVAATSATDSPTASTSPARRGDGPSPDQVERITAGDQLLLQAIAQLERRESVVVRRLKFQATLDGLRLSNDGYGGYWQQGRGEELRVRLELRLNDDISLLQVSNGRLLWTDQQTPTRRTITQIDLRRIRADAARAAAKLDELQPGQASWLPLQPELPAYYGGLPRMLSSLSDSFTFRPPQAMRYKIATESSDSAVEMPAVDLPVFALVGQWKPSRLAKLFPEIRVADGDANYHEQLAKLPQRLPQEVLLLVGQADLFPYRIEFRRLPQLAHGNATNPYQLMDAPLVLLQLGEVAFDVPINAGQFDYAPPNDAKWEGLTDDLLEKIRRQREEQLAARKREPAR